METLQKKTPVDMGDKEIIYSQAIKAGKRIYYLDVKKNRKDEMFLAITESKKTVTGEGEDSQVSFEKHKIFLYKEDFEKFVHGLQQVIGFIESKQGCHNKAGMQEGNTMTDDKPLATEADPHLASALDKEIKIDIDF